MTSRGENWLWEGLTVHSISITSGWCDWCGSAAGVMWGDPPELIDATERPLARACEQMKKSDFAKIQTDFMVRLRKRGYPGRWLQHAFEEIKYKVERPSALKPVAHNTAAGDPTLHVLKLTHNPVWDELNLNPIWRELNETWRETGTGYPEFRFMALFKKPPALSNRLNTTNRNTLNTIGGACDTVEPCSSLAPGVKSPSFSIRPGSTGTLMTGRTSKIVRD
ncbi:hypothetical protein B0H19DRAFT_1067801 [Mycena capillaripes]|nr:hypothetical protein B0H19DRAFT_1067801 [Mycena capillaripes]